MESRKRGATSTEVSVAVAKVGFDDSTETVGALAAANKANDDLKQQIQN